MADYKKKQQIKRRWMDYFEQRYNSETEIIRKNTGTAIPITNEQKYVKDFQNRKSKLLKL